MKVKLKTLDFGGIEQETRSLLIPTQELDIIAYCYRPGGEWFQASAPNRWYEGTLMVILGDLSDFINVVPAEKLSDIIEEDDPEWEYHYYYGMYHAEGLKKFVVIRERYETENKRTTRGPNTNT